MNKIRENRLRIPGIILLVITGLNALAAGYAFMIDPSGKSLGMNTDYLRNSPFMDFLIPGMILFVANGVLSLDAAILALTRRRHYQRFIIFQGCVLVAWITIQVSLLEFFHLLHLIFGIIGILLIVIGVIISKRLSHSTPEKILNRPVL